MATIMNKASRNTSKDDSSLPQDMYTLRGFQINGNPSISHLTNALSCAEKMVYKGISLSKEEWYQLLEEAIRENDVSASQRIHLFLIGNDGVNKHDSILDDRLIHIFAKNNKVFEANLVFLHAKKLEIHTWNGIISAHEASKCHESVFLLFSEMQCNGIKPNKLTYLCILKVCGLLKMSAQSFLVHGHIMGSHFEPETVVENALLNVYMKCGNIRDAENVFERLRCKDVVSWNAMISGYAGHGQYIPAFLCFRKLYQEGIVPTNMTYSCILNVCGILEVLNEGRLVHKDLIEAGFPVDIILRNTLIDMYAKCGSLRDAYKTFKEDSQRDVVSWSSLIAGCTRYGDDLLALQLFTDMHKEGIMPDRVSYLNVLPACGNVGAIQEGMWIYNKVIWNNLNSDIIIGSTIVDMFAKCGCIHEAQKVFDALQGRNLVSWNAIIGGYTEHKQGAYYAIRNFEKMMNDRVDPNKITLMCILKACGTIDAREERNWIHNKVVNDGLESDTLIQVTLIDMYMKLGCFREARRVFENILNPNLCIWNAIITGYAHHKHSSEVFELFECMHRKGPRPDETTYTNIFKVCTDLNAMAESKLFHDWMIRDGVTFDVVIGNSLINMYMKIGHLEEAEKVFERLPNKNVVSWNSMISGFSWHGFETSAIELFEKLRQEKHIHPDKVTFLSMLKTCSNVGATEQGKLTHDLLVKNGLEGDLLIEGALIDMYVKSNTLHSAQKLLPAQNVASWGAIISGYALQGSLILVEQCFEEMKDGGVRPDEQIYTSILAACSHSGSVEKGYKYFHSMQVEYGFTPSVEHCNGMIDLLCRAGHLAEAKEVLCTMQGIPNLSGWMSLFTACRIYGNRELAKHCFDEALNLDPDLAVGYVAMSNVLIDAS